MKRFIAFISVALAAVFCVNTYTTERNRVVYADDYYDEIIDELPYIDVVQKYYEAYGYDVERTEQSGEESLIISKRNCATITIKFSGNEISEYRVGNYYAGYAVDEDGKVLRWEYGKNDDTFYGVDYSYDNDGNLLSGGLSENTYNNGLLASSTYYNGDVVSYEYDGEDRLTAVRYNGELVFTYSYNEDVVTQYSVIKDIYTTYTETDDTKIFAGEDWSLSYVSTDSGFNKTHSLFGEEHSVSATSDSLTVDSRVIRYAKDYFGRIDDYGVYNVRYMNDEMYESYITEVYFGQNSYVYEYDNGNVIRSIYEHPDGEVPDGEILYEYDDLNRLVREDNGPANKTYIYEYDDNGNVTIRIGDYRTGFNASESKRSVSSDGTVTYLGQTVVYDDYGVTPLSWGDYNFTWQYGNRLTAISGPDYEITYDFDNDGNRIGKIVNGTPTNYYYEDGKVIYESREWDGEIIYYIYGYDNNRVGFIYDGQTYYYIYDGLKNVVGIAEPNGTVVVEYSYSAYGQTVGIYGSKADTVGVVNPYRYKGYRYEEETGLYYVGSRYYCPDTGRFICADDPAAYSQNVEVGVCYNLFAYANNNPVKYYDPDGRVITEVICGVTIGVKALIAVAAIVCIAVLIVCYPAIKSLIENIKYSDLTDFFNACKESKLSFWEKWRKSPKLCTHHIVARTHHLAAATRVIVEPHLTNIVTDERNLVRIKERFHHKLHRKSYFIAQYKCFSPLEGKRTEILNMLKTQKIIISIVNYTA